MDEYSPTKMMSDEKGTLIEQFDEFMNEYGVSAESIIAFLSFTNSLLLTKIASNNITEEYKKELVDFIDYYDNNFKKYSSEVNSNWEDGPVTLRAARAFREGRGHGIEVYQINDSEIGNVVCEKSQAHVILDYLNNYKS